MFACLHAAGNPQLLTECARFFSPRVEETAPGTVLLDIGGLGHLFGTPREIAQALANRVGIPANIAVATDPDAAVHAARGIPGVTVIEPGREAQALAPLPVNLLPGTPETAEVLHAWGIRTFGQLAALPPLGVAARLGDEGTHLLRLARGEAGRQLRTREDALRFEEELELEHPLELLEPLSFLLARLLNEICARLVSRALSANEIHLALILEKAPLHQCRLRLPVPMRDPAVFLKLLQLELNARPPAAPVLKIRLTLQPVRPRTQQHGLFVALSPEPEKLEITLARIANLLGTNNVGTPEILNTHRPDSFRMSRFSAQASTPPEPPAKEGLILHRYRPAKHAQVLLHGTQPARISCAHVEGRILACAGPWRTSGDWWLPEPWDHAEWDIALSDGAFYRLYEDIRTARWFLAGNYD